MGNNSNSSTFFYKHVFRENLYWSVVFIAVGVLTVVLNLATILTFVINIHLRRRSVYCLINLAVADMLFGVIDLPYVIIVYYLQWLYNSLKDLLKITWYLALFSSLFSLALVSLERVYATFFPFRHRTTRARIYNVVFTIAWLLPLPLVITLYLIPSISRKFILQPSAVGYLFCLIIICTSYIAIFVKVKIQGKRLQPNQQQTATIQIRQKREQHLAMTLFIVTVLSLIAWLPLTILGIPKYQDRLSYSVHRLIVLLQRANSLINPIIYVFRMRNYRRALTQLIFNCSRDRQQINPAGYHGNHEKQQEPVIELPDISLKKTSVTL